MATTGKERQRKYKERLKALNKMSVTVDLSEWAYSGLAGEKERTGKTYSEIIDQAVQNYIQPGSSSRPRKGRPVTSVSASEEKFRTIFENANDVIIYVNMAGIIIDINKRVEKVFGYKPEEVIGKSITEFKILDSQDAQASIRSLEDIARASIHPKQTPDLSIHELKTYHKNGTLIYIEVNPRLVQKDGKKIGVLNIIRDTTKRKQAEEELRRLHDDLENKVKERTESLEEVNTAMKVLLKKMDEAKNELEEKILLNVKELVTPIIERLKKSELNKNQKTDIDLLDSNLKEIISPLSHELTSKYLNLTHGEVQVANLIKHGKTTKEIAEILNLSDRTIDFHRAKIRKKVGIHKTKVNLRTYLLSLQ